MRKEANITVLKVAPGKTPEVVTLRNELRALQEAVSIGAEYVGLIEIVELDAETCILCNEEGKLIGLEPNRRLGYDVLCGVFYVTGQNKEGDLASLKPEAIQYYSQRFQEPEDLTQADAEKALLMKFFVC